MDEAGKSVEPAKADLKGVPVPALIEELKLRKLTSADVKILQSFSAVEESEQQALMGSAEELDLTEQFSEKVKSSSVLNIDRGGFSYVNRGEILGARVVDAIERGLRQTEKCTTMRLYPLSQFTSLPSGVDQQNIAIYFGYLSGEKYDQHGRDGSLHAVMAMTRDDADRFADAVKENPTLAYSVIRKLNKGPIRKWDDTPVKIICGSHTEIVKTDYSTIQSKPFPQGYNPNPA